MSTSLTEKHGSSNNMPINQISCGFGAMGTFTKEWDTSCLTGFSQDLT